MENDFAQSIKNDRLLAWGNIEADFVKASIFKGKKCASKSGWRK